ncbi:Major facilitator superfamily [Seminavis robusta]|uniref:Major facilitator superfamily n=1 Tax=Seminavis robusta TaxID=568900 RepID=A0A9N8DJK4_9STRA|nr:Major facilitator superfamily [Seminavis robusta]|eukprot:Sro178_g078260.1 Major facilitator superfamily (744) ;mRNA; f:79530-81970
MHQGMTPASAEHQLTVEQQAEVATNEVDVDELEVDTSTEELLPPVSNDINKWDDDEEPNSAMIDDNALFMPPTQNNDTQEATHTINHEPTHSIDSGDSLKQETSSDPPKEQLATVSTEEEDIVNPDQNKEPEQSTRVETPEAIAPEEEENPGSTSGAVDQQDTHNSSTEFKTLVPPVVEGADTMEVPSESNTAQAASREEDAPLSSDNDNGNDTPEDKHSDATDQAEDSEESLADNNNEQKQQTSLTTCTENNLPWWYPHFRGRPVFYGTKEALGWACTAVGMAAVLIGTGAFILPAMAKLAKEEAGCETEAPSSSDPIPPCEGKVYGIKPSSLLTVMSTVVGLASAFVIPPVGAIVDYTSHRRLIGRWLSALYAVLILCMVFLNEDSWFALVIILLLAISIGWAISMLFNAYLPELTDDENRLNEFSKAFTVLIFSAMVVYLAIVMGIGLAFGVADDDVALARIAAIVAFCLSSVLLYASWGLLFEERMASHELPPGQTLWGAGFRQVYRTSIKIWNDYRALKWFYISICFGDAAIQSLSVIAITFITDHLEFSSQQVGAAALLLLLGSIPGAIVGAFINKKFNPIKSSALAVFGMLVGTGLGSIILKGPGQETLTYMFAFSWGFGTGWKYTGDRVLAAGIIPQGQDAELMGFYMFCGQIFAWAPSLVFTILNEAGVSQRIGLATLCVVFLGALLSYIMMGDYAEAVGAADRLRVDTIPSVAHRFDKGEKSTEISPEEVALP